MKLRLCELVPEVKNNFWFDGCRCTWSKSITSELDNAFAKALSIYVEKELPQDIKGRSFYCKQKLGGSLLEDSWQNTNYSGQKP